MHGRIMTGGLAMLVAFSMAAGAAPATSPAAEASREKILAAARAREIVRMQGISEWIQRSHPDQRAILTRVYEPVIEGNRRDYPQNLRAAEYYQSLAQEAAKDKDRRASMETYASVAKSYMDLAKLNYAILKGMENFEIKAIQDALTAIPRAEESILEKTRHAPKRTWFLPAELAENSGEAQPDATPATDAKKPTTAPKAATPAAAAPAAKQPDATK